MLKRIASWLAIVVMLAALCSSYGYAAEAQAASVKNTVSRAGGVEEDDGDIDVPFEPTIAVRSVGIEKKPTKLQYLKGEALDLSGMVVRAYYSDNTNRIVENYQVSGYDPNTVGEQTIRVSLDGKTAIFKVTVLAGGVEEDDGDIDVPLEPTIEVRDVRIEKKPAKLQYLKGEALDLSGMVVRAYYSNNTDRVVENYQVSGYDPNTVGEQTIRVSLDGKTATFNVTVLAVGDASGDGLVDGRDATLLLQYAAGWEVEVKELAADANGDGLVDGRDATLLLQYAAGWDVTLGS